MRWAVQLQPAPCQAVVSGAAGFGELGSPYAHGWGFGLLWRLQVQDMRRFASDDGEDQNVPLKSVITCCWRFVSLSECTLHSPQEKSTVTLPRNYEIRGHFFFLIVDGSVSLYHWYFKVDASYSGLCGRQGRGTQACWPSARPGPVCNLGCVPCPSWGREPCWQRALNATHTCMTRMPSIKI